MLSLEKLCEFLYAIITILVFVVTRMHTKEQYLIYLEVSKQHGLNTFWKERKFRKSDK
jgi:hypothetical protein